MPVRRIASMAALAAAYYATGRLGLRLATVNPLVTAVWPPTGVAVAGLVLIGRRAWPAVALAAFLINLTSGANLSLAAGITVGNTLAPLAAVTLLGAGYVQLDLSRLRDVLTLVAAAGGGMLISATGGTLTLIASGAVGPPEYARVWLVWWVGDAMGVILVAPFLLSLASRGDPRYPCSRSRQVESVAVLVVAALACHLIFRSDLTLTFLVFPIVLWTAARLPQPAVATFNLIVAASAIWATLHGQGPFSHPPTTRNLIDLQFFNASVACTSLIVAALVRERTFAHRRLQEALSSLEEAVQRRTEELSATNRALSDEIAEHRHTEHTLRQSEERFRSFFEGSVQGAFRVRLDGTILGLNPALARMLGYRSPAEFLERVQGVRELLADRERGRQLAALVQTQREVRDFEIGMRHRDGGTVEAAVHLRLVEAEGERVYEGLLLDITERKRVREALEAALERERLASSELEQLSAMKDRFIANISHELRTPITLTLGPLQHVLRDHHEEVTADVLGQLQVAERSQHRLLKLVDQLLDLARLEQGATRLCVAPVVDVNRFVEERAEPFETVAKLRGIDFRLGLDPRAVGADLWLDHDEIDVVLSNLLSNALKFTEAGVIEIRTEMTEHELLLTVADTGSGIREADLPHVFDRFRQGDGAGSAWRGTGLGLALVKEIVDLHGGEISVSSLPGFGTAFQVSFPLGTEHLRPDTCRQPACDPPAVIGATAHGAEMDGGDGDLESLNAAAEASFDPRRPLVLYIEDVHDLRLHVRRLLSDHCNVFLAGDGRQGLELTRRYLPDLVIVDEVMPVMRGSEFVQALRNDPDLRSIPVIFVTALAAAEARVAGLQVGADDYLTKPFHEAELQARVRNLVNARIQRRLLIESNRRLEARVEEQLAELVRTGELRRFLPPAVSDRLLTGELTPDQAMTRCRVTAVVLGVAGISELAERLEPEDFSELVNDYLTEVAAVAVAHGGVVDHLSSDGVMILFGAPHGGQTEDHAWSAVQAAMAMRDRLVAVATGCRRRGISVDLRIRAGINSGHATIGFFGGDLQRTYTAMGPVVSIASRLRAAAAPGQILCGGPTHAAVAARVRSSRHEPLRQRGGGMPVEVFELLDAIGGRTEVELNGAVAASTVPEPGGRRPLFRREGDYWTVAFSGPVFRVQHAKGFQHLAQLLAHPGTEFHVLQLVAVERGDEAVGVRGPASNGGTASLGGDVGDVLDAQARVAYKRRLDELREEVEEGSDFHDPERVARARAEIDALTDQLAGAMGLSGRGRRVRSDVERARVNLTKRIRAAMSLLGEHDPALEHHLRAAVRTGTYCSYSPDPGLEVVWNL